MVPLVVALSVLAVLAVVATGALFLRASHHKREARAGAGGASRVCDIDARGATRVVGRVVALDRTLRSPVGRAKCVYYRLLIEERDGDGWRGVLDDEEAVTFAVRDATGEAVVPGKHLDVSIRAEEGGRSGSLKDLTPAQQRALRDQYPDERFSFTKGMRYEEVALELGDAVAVTGDASRPKHQTPRFRSSADEPVRVRDAGAAAAALDRAGTARTSFLLASVTGAAALGLMLTLVVLAVRMKVPTDAPEVARGGTSTEPAPNEAGQPAPKTDRPLVRQYDAEGLPIGNDYDAVMVRLNHRFQQNNFHLYQLEMWNVRALKGPGFTRGAEVFRTLRGHAGTPAVQPSVHAIPFHAWQQAMEWASKGEVPELCQMLGTERLEPRQSDLFNKLTTFKDPRCAAAVAPFLAVPARRSSAEHLLKQLDATAEPFVLPYLAANQDKDTRVAALQVVAEVGTAQSARAVEAMTRDTDLLVNHHSKIVFEKLSRKFGVEQDLLAVVAALKAGITAENAVAITDNGNKLDAAYKPNHPQRAAIFKGLVECCYAPDPKGYGKRASFLGALKWSSADDLAVLCKLLADSGGESVVFLKLKEYKDPRTADAVAAFLANPLKSAEAAEVLKAIGGPAERAVAVYALPTYPNGTAVPFATRLAAIDLLGDIGTKDCVPLLRQLTADGNVQAAANKALLKVANRVR